MTDNDNDNILDSEKFTETPLAPFFGADYRPEPATMFRRTDGQHGIYPGRLHVFYGESSSLKTWTALVAVTQVLHRGGTVVWIDMEDTPQTVANRLRLLGVEPQEVARCHYLRPEGKFGAEDATNVVSTYAPNLVVIDSMSEVLALLGADGYVSQQVADVHRTIRGFTDNGAAAVLIIDHVTKAHTNATRGPIGSERKLSGIDGTAYAFTLIDPFGVGKEGSARIKLDKDRVGTVQGICADDATFGFVTLLSCNNRVAYRVALPKEHNNDLRVERRDNILRAVQAAGKEGIRKKALYEKVGGARYLFNEAVDYLVEHERLLGGPPDPYVYNDQIIVVDFTMAMENFTDDMMDDPEW